MHTGTGLGEPGEDGLGAAWFQEKAKQVPLLLPLGPSAHLPAAVLFKNQKKKKKGRQEGGGEAEPCK